MTDCIIKIRTPPHLFMFWNIVFLSFFSKQIYLLTLHFLFVPEHQTKYPCPFLCASPTLHNIAEAVSTHTYWHNTQHFSGTAICLQNFRSNRSCFFGNMLLGSSYSMASSKQAAIFDVDQKVPSAIFGASRKPLCDDPMKIVTPIC